MNGHLGDEELIGHAFALLDPCAAAAAQAHLAACPECRARQAGLQDRLGQLSVLKDSIAAPEPLIADTLRRVRLAATAPPKHAWYYRWGILTASAAATAVVLIGLPVITRWGRPPPESNRAAPAPEGSIGGVEVTLARTPDALEPVHPLPDTGTALPEAIDGAAEIAELASADRAPAATLGEPVARLNLPEMTPAPTGIVIAADRARGDRAPLLERTANERTYNSSLPAAPGGTAAPGGRRLVIRAAAAAPAETVIRFAFPAQSTRGRAGPREELEYLSGADGLRLRNRSAGTVRVQVDGAAGGLFELGVGAETNLMQSASTP